MTVINLNHGYFLFISNRCLDSTFIWSSQLHLFNTETNREAYILLYAIFSISILSISILKNYYKDYYLINFSEKIRISIITWIFSIFIQLIAHNYLLVKIDIYSLISWILIPIIILIMRYLCKN